ncbi:MAG: hypothetical protein LBV46_01385, partial [Bacteroidales bacterium]|nr:hypothetical protein [Bacteroidales bacterium]
GIKAAHIPTAEYGRTESNIDEFGNITTFGYMDVNNDDCPRKFVPDLATGINFLFHSKNNPRHNFILGFNMNIGFIPRYKGYYSVTPPDFTKKDCAISYTSTYFGFNIGYEFRTFPKPIHKTKAYRKKQSYNSFDNTQPIHSFGFNFSNGVSIDPELKNQGVVSLATIGSYVPELVLKYSCAIRKGWGVTAEVPIGFFSRRYMVGFEGGVPSDTVWANGVVGAGQPGFFEFKSPYIGLSLKASYLASIHKNMFIQPEVGIKFLPFIFSSKHWYIDEASGEQVIFDENATYGLVYMHCDPVISSASYFVPDITFALNFMVHGKNPQNNFVFGLNVNIGLMDRIHFVYKTTDVLPAYAQSSGEFGWRMSSIGFHIGYQFMKGKEKMIERL